MATPLRLEIFDTPDPAPTPPAALEHTRQEAFAQGHRAGWAEALATQEREQTRIRADLARTLAGLSFTCHEARQHILHALAPLLREMAEKLLPVLGRETLAQLVVETLTPLAAELADTAMVLRLNPADRARLAPVLATHPPLPLHLIDDPDLQEGQVHLTRDTQEQHIDLSGAIAAIRTAIRDFYQTQQEAKQHG